MRNGFEQRLVFINSHPKQADHALGAYQPQPERLAVAISSQTGSGALLIAARLAEELQAQTPATEPRWEVFDKSLMAKVLEDHHWPTRMAKFMPEDASSTLDEVLDELLGLHPPSWAIVQQSVETVLKLVRTGHVILVGWGANVITNKLPNVFQVRLVGSLEKRTLRIEQRDHLGRKQALALIARQDRGRERYVRRHFDQNLSDALLYHLTVNTDRFSDEEAARLIGDTALSRHPARAPQDLMMARPL